MTITLNTVAANLINNNAQDFANVAKLASAVRKHERASGAFLAELDKLNDTDFKRSVTTLAASFKADASKVGITYDNVVPLCDALHKAALVLRNIGKQSIQQASKDKNGFDISRAKSVEVRALDSLLSSIANLKSNASRISVKVATAKAA